jgi:hypothetical protein
LHHIKDHKIEFLPSDEIIKLKVVGEEKRFQYGFIVEGLKVAAEISFESKKAQVLTVSNLSNSNIEIKGVFLTKILDKVFNPGETHRIRINKFKEGDYSCFFSVQKV